MQTITNPKPDIKNGHLKSFLTERLKLHFTCGLASSGQGLDIYLNSPAGQPIVCTASQGEREIGRNVLIPVWVQTPQGRLKAALNTFVLVEEKYRGLGIFTVLAAESFKYAAEYAIEFVYAFPGEKSHPNWLRYSRFKDIGRAPILVKPVDPGTGIEKFLSKPLARALNSVLKPLARAYGALTSPRTSPGYEIHRLYEFPDDTDETWEEASRERDFMARKDRAFLSWRYAGREHIKLLSRNIQTGKGALLVGGIRNELGFKLGAINEILLPAADHKPLSAQLLRTIENIFRRAGVDFIAGMALPGTKTYGVLRRAGYFEMPGVSPKGGFRVMGAHLTARAERLYRLPDWLFTLGDLGRFQEEK
jgi:GNAT superfamily N-acetyltransferase